MGPRPHRRLTDPWWLLRYVTNNPRRALVYGVLAAVVIGVVTVSLAVEAVPVWVGAVAAGLAFVALSRESLGRLRLVVGASEGSAGGVAPGDGAVAVSGAAVRATDETLTSEWDERECLAYEYTKKRRKSRSNEGSTTQTRTKQRSLPFFVDDGTGRVLVDADGGSLTLTADAEGKSGSTTHEEGYVQAGDEVTVYGEVTAPRGDADGSFRHPEVVRGQNRAITIGPTYGDMVITDRSGWRIAAGQAFYFVGWLAVGIALVAVGVAAALGIVSV